MSSNKDFNTKKENEIIVLSNLTDKEVDKNLDYVCEYFNSWELISKKLNKEKGKKEKEIEEEVKKEILEKKEKLKEQSIKSYYKISEKKNQELEAFFKTPKLKVYLCNPIFIGKGKIGKSTENKFIIYENNYFNKLYELKLYNIKKVTSVIELDNNDLIICGKTCQKTDYYEINNEFIFIYRLKDKNYSLIQSINENISGYKFQKYRSGCITSLKKFSLCFVKKLSGNRFMSISNYGIRLYSLNNENKYSLVLMDVHLEGIDKIYEINENNYIFCTKNLFEYSKRVTTRGFVLIEKVNIRNITEEEINNRIKKLNNKEKMWDYYKDKKYDIKVIEKIFSSLELTFDFNNIFEYSAYGRRPNISNFIILKNKYFTVLVDNNLLFFNLIDNSIIKRYTFLKNGEKNIYISKSYDIRKWKNFNDNEFLLIGDKTINLIEFNENNIKEKVIINLKIIGQYYFPDASDLLSDKENRFYVKKNDSILVY